MRSLCRSFCAICPATSRHPCRSGYLPGNGQRTAAPGAACDTPGKRTPCLHERANERKNIFKKEITENLFTFNKTTNEEFTQICYSNGRKVTVQPGLCIHCTDRMKA